MKQKLTLCLLFLSLIGLSQAPELINYQGIARDANGLAITGNVDLKFDLHQGGVNSPTVFTEAQTVSTTSLGLFSTQIGKTSNLGNINWQSGSLFLEVSLRLSGGTYTSLGTQQLVSVPFSMFAKSVPSTYSNNILTIGSNAFTLTPSTGAVYTAGAGISITSGSIITNTAPDVPVTFTSTSSNIAVNGTYPNFSLSYTPPANSAPTLTLNGANNNSLSAGNNTVVLNTYTTGSGLIMTGGPNYTISSSAANPTIVGAGAAIVTPATGTNFTVSVANPTLSSSGNSLTLTQGTLVTTATIAATPATSLSPGTNVNITGTNPYTIAATPTLNFLTANTLSISGGNSVTIAPTLSVSGNGSLSVGPLTNSVNIAPNLVGDGAVTVTGTFPNYTIYATPAGSVSVVSTTVTGTNLATVTSPTTNLYNVDVQPPVFTSSGPVTISGTYPNLTIFSTATPTYTNGAGISITSGSIITNTSPNQTVTVASGSNINVSGTYPAYTISSPTPTFTPSGPVTITGTYPTMTINSTAAPIYTSGTGISITSGSIITNTSPDQIVTVGSGSNINVSGTYPAYTISSPSPTFTPSGPVTITGTYPNMTINSTAAPSASFSTGGIVTISTITANSYSVSVLPATIAVTYTSDVNPSVTSTGNSYNINIPPTQAPNITVSYSLAAAGISTTSANNFNLNIPAPNIVVSQTPGAVGITTTSANNYNINIPLANGAWGALGNAGTTPGTNFIGTTDANVLHFRTNNTLAMVINTLGSVGIGTTTPGAKLHVSSGAATGATGIFEITSTSTNGDALIAVSTSAVNNTYALRAINTNTNTATSYGAMIEGGTIVRPKNISSAFAFKAQTNGGSDIFSIRDDGAVTMTTSTTGNDLIIYNSGTNVGIQLKSSASTNFGLIIGQNNVATNILSYDNTPMYFGTNGANRVVVSAAGNFGVGNMSPAAKLDVNGTANVAGNMTVTGTVKIADGTQGANKVLTSDAAGNASWQNNGVPAGAIMAYGGATIPSGWTVCDGTTLSRTTYSVLFAAIGTAWGVGDGTTTFNVPDMRGMFLRGVDGTAGADPDKGTRTATNSGNSGNNVGSKQADELQAHTHTIGNTLLGALLGTSMISASGTGNTTGSTGGSTETRPKNVYVYYMIKH